MEQVQQDIVVTFNDIDNQMYAELAERGDDFPLPFEQAVFEKAIGYQLGSGFIGVQGADGNFTIYPSERIRQVNINIKE